MSFRETMNKNSSLTTIGAVLVIVVVLGLIAWQFWPSGYKKGGYTELYYTNDDGKSYFAADRLTNIPPFDKDGKQAVQAQVVRCGSGKAFVGFMTRFSEPAKKALEEAKSKGQLTPELLTGYATQVEAKQPGQSEWVGWQKMGETGVGNITCPDAMTSPKPVFP